MYKGKTQIILKNVKNGKEEVAESNNVFLADNIASFIRKLSNSAGVLSDSTVSGRELYKTLVGGLFLFDKTVPTNSYMMPVGTKMIGNGAYNVTNNGVPRELGSWNDIESGVDGDEIKLVWDFTTSQANGNIKCVSLTSDLGGYIGMGNPSGEVSSTKKTFSAYGGATKPTSFGNGHLINNKLYRVTENSRQVAIALNNGGTIPISVANAVVDELDLNSNLSSPTESDSFTISISGVGDVLTENSISVGPYHLQNGKVAYRFYKSNIGSYLESNDTYYLLIIDFVNRSYELKELTNLSGVSLYATSYSYGYSPVNNIVPISENEILAYGTDNKLYYMNYTDNTCLEVDTGSLTYGASRHYIITTALHNGLSLCFISGLGIFDKINKTVYPINCNNTDTNYYEQKYSYDNDNDLFSLISSPSYYYTNPFYLATINNITPVTKTSEQTMKVVYTLTKE